MIVSLLHLFLFFILSWRSARAPSSPLASVYMSHVSLWLDHFFASWGIHSPSCVHRSPAEGSAAHRKASCFNRQNSSESKSHSANDYPNHQSLSTNVFTTYADPHGWCRPSLRKVRSELNQSRSRITVGAPSSRPLLHCVVFDFHSWLIWCFFTWVGFRPPASSSTFGWHLPLRRLSRDLRALLFRHRYWNASWPFYSFGQTFACGYSPFYRARPSDVRNHLCHWRASSWYDGSALDLPQPLRKRPYRVLRRYHLASCAGTELPSKAR